MPQYGMHKAKPHTPADDAAGVGHCGTCGQPVNRVPGGAGPTWVHRDSGAVAAPNPPTIVKDPAVEFVRLAWRESVSTHFTVRVTSIEQMRAMADAAGWNDWVDSFLAEVWPICASVEFGRAGSMLLNVTVPFWTHHVHGQSEGPQEMVTDADRVAIAERIIAWAEARKADEISTQQFDGGSPPSIPRWADVEHSVDVDAPVWGGPGEHPYLIRIWWD